MVQSSYLQIEILKRQGVSCNGRNSNGGNVEGEDRSPPPSATPMDLITNPNIRKKFFILAFDWVANAVVYNGLSYNTTNLGVSDYLAFFIGEDSNFSLPDLARRISANKARTDAALISRTFSKVRAREQDGNF